MLDGRWCGKDIIFDGCNSYSFLANYVWWNDILGKKIYIAVRNLYSKIFNLSINHMFIVFEIDNYDKLQQCCPDIYNNTVGSQDKIAEKYFIMGGFPEDNGSKMVVKYNEKKDREALEESLNNRPSDWKEVFKSTFTVDWDYQQKNVDIGSDCEEKVMCKLLTGAENYQKNPVDYHANGDNCVKWVKSIFYAIDINVEVDFSGLDFDWWTLIDKSHFNE